MMPKPLPEADAPWSGAHERPGVAKAFLERIVSLFSPLRRERRRNTLAWTRIKRSAARSLVVNSVACVMAVRVVDEGEVEVGDTEAADRSRCAMERCTRKAEVSKCSPRTISGPKKCFFDPGLNLIEFLREINKVVTISAECALERTLRFPFLKCVFSPFEPNGYPY